MSRVKRGTISRSKHKKVLKAAKGYRMTRSRLIKVAKQAVLHAKRYAYVGRKQKKREMRRLWIVRINEAVKSMGWTYGQFMHALKQKNIQLNRKILANLITNDEVAFKKLVEKVRS